MSIISVLSSLFVLNVKGIMDLEEFQILDTIAYFSAKLFSSSKANEASDEFDNQKVDEPENLRHGSNYLSPNLVILMRDFDLLMEDPETKQPVTEAQYLEELLRLESNRNTDNHKLNPMKNRICNYFWKRKLFTLP